MVFLILLSCCSEMVHADNLSRKQYINKYKKLAIAEMNRVGIPASITLAQGLLESASGNSTLARRGNNHFGIKCHDWRGKSIRMDDDRKNECFRKYHTVMESFRDHSDFLRNRSRYSFLFKLSIKDYRGWAHGLKRAGYATDSRYAHRLIKIIEEEKLYLFDKKGRKSEYVEPQSENRALADVDKAYEIDPFGARLEIVNGIHYIVVKKGDTFYSIERNLGVSRRKLLRYNELQRGYVLQVGQVLFLHSKKSKASRGNTYHRVKEGDTMYSISQIYGVRISKLYKYNLMRKGDKPIVGDRIYLRKKGR